MAENSDKNKGKFSFDRDPGKMEESGDLDFTFSDIPVLGQDAATRDSFSASPPPQDRDAKDAAIASFEEMLRDEPGAGAAAEDGEEVAQVPGDFTVSVLDTVPAEADKDAGEDEFPEDESEGLDEEFVREQRKKWEAKVKRRKRMRRRVISMRVVYVLAPVTVLAGFIYLLVSMWFNYQARQEEKKNYVSLQRSSSDQQAAEEARKLKQAMEEKLAEADAAFGAGEYRRALDIYQELGQKRFFKDHYLLPRIGRTQIKLQDLESALQSYEAAIAAGPREASVYIEMADLLNEYERFDDALLMLEAGNNAFPESPLITAMLAETYHRRGQAEKSLEKFSTLKRADMNQAQLLIFGELLVDAGDREEARKVFFFAAKRFNDLTSYLAATELAGDISQQIEILAHASGALVAGKDKSVAFLLLVGRLLSENRAGEAKEQLDNVDPKILPTSYVEEYLDAVLRIYEGESLRDKLSRLIMSMPEKIEIQSRIQDVLVVAKQEPLTLDIYGSWWVRESDSPYVNYLYGRILGSGKTARECYLRARQLGGGFFDASFALAKIYYMEKNWPKAKEVLGECVRLKPRHRESRSLLTKVRLYSGEGDAGAALADYDSFLREEGVSDLERAKLLIGLATYLPQSGQAQRYLDIIGSYPDEEELYAAEALRLKLIYGNLSEKDFSGIHSRESRNIHTLYLLAMGKGREVLMMPTPPDEFPEFWKVFLCRLSGIETWKEHAGLLIERHSMPGEDASIPIIANMWLGKLSPDEAREMSDRVYPENEPLFYFMLAEEYRANRQPTKARVCYLKAKSMNPGPLYRVIDYFSRNNRRIH